MQKSYTLKIFKIYWDHLKKFRGLFYLSIVCLLFGSAGFVIAPLYYKEFFDVLSSGLNIALKAQDLIAILWKLLIVYSIGWIGWRVVSFATSYLQSRVMADLYNTCFAYLHKHSVNFFNNNFVGSLVKKVNRFPNAFLGLSDMFFFEVLTLVFNTVFITAILFYKNWQVGLAVIAWIALYAFLNYKFSLYKLKFDIKRSEEDSKVTGFLADTITNHQNVKLFNGYAKEKKDFGKTVEGWRYLRQFTWNISSYFESFQSFSMIITELVIFYIAIRLWQKGLVTIGDFVLLQVYLINIFHRFWDFGRLIRRYYEFISEAQEMMEIFETPRQIQDTLMAKELGVSKGAISFKDVVFSYSGTRKIFSKFNLDIKAKKRLALVGPSGVGKSSIVNLLLRNYDVDGGSIKIDDQKIFQVTLESLWRNIALVPQDPILFHRTLMENIRYGRHEATNEEVVEAARLAHCDEFITNFTEGYQTYVGERGVKLSGGERQRIAIARAILKNAPILILDEATSSLDSESEHLIQKALDVLMKDKTVIVIAHRLSTIIKSDRIIVINEGKVEEDGSHVELVKQKGLYASLWARQVCGFIE